MRVVLADDHRIVRDGLRWMLADDEVEVVGEADSGRALLDLLEHTAPDVVLLDLRMPGMDGLQALEELRRRHPQVRVIVLTMHMEEAYVRRAIELGAYGYLLKRTSRQELLAALRAVHGGDAYIQGDLVASVVEQALGPSASGTRSDSRFTAREREILEMVAGGLGNKQIARKLSMSEHSVKSDLKAIFKRLDATSRAEAVAIGMRLGVID